MGNSGTGAVGHHLCQLLHRLTGSPTCLLEEKGTLLTASPPPSPPVFPGVTQLLVPFLGSQLAPGLTSLPLWEERSEGGLAQGSFKLLPLSGVLDYVKFCVSPLRVESLFSVLWAETYLLLFSH